MRSGEFQQKLQTTMNWVSTVEVVSCDTVSSRRKLAEEIAGIRYKATATEKYE
jgi:hypothetical protein